MSLIWDSLVSENNEIKIKVPDGYEVDNENSTFECIKFKPKIKKLPKTFSELIYVDGFCVDYDSTIYDVSAAATLGTNRNIFSTEEQAEACIAMAQLSQLMKVYNDGWIPDWTSNIEKYVLMFYIGKIHKEICTRTSCFLAFKTFEIREEFLNNFESLIKTAKPLL